MDDEFTTEELDATTLVEEFYNAFHDKAGRFTFKKGGKRGKIHVPMSENARKSNAILRRLASDRKSKEYKTAKQRIAGSWADREKGQGGLRGAKGANSKKADTARAMNAKTGAKTRTAMQPNKDGSTALKGKFKVSGDKRQDAIKITQLDRGSAERKAAATAFQKHYG